MPYDDPDPTDPMTLTGVEVSVENSNCTREMAACFIEEYVRSGLSAESILEIFVSGAFAGPSLALKELGRDAIDAMIRYEFQLRGPGPRRLQIEQSSGSLGLPVLEQ